ncbi:unnamed protein product [Pedinophyceae sp. YPF-701]|nr:unnamed protein product [Pedinophyceae sp. YPF-701]
MLAIKGMSAAVAARGCRPARARRMAVRAAAKPSGDAGRASHVAHIKPGETSEQAEERREQESMRVQERVKYITCREDYDREIAAAGSKLVLLEVTSDNVCQTGLKEEVESNWRRKQSDIMQPCVNLKHSFQRVARECDDAVFLEIIGDMGPETKALCKDLGVDTIPSLLFIREGRELWRHAGHLNAAEDLGEGMLFYNDTLAGNEKATSFVKDLHSGADLQAFLASRPKGEVTCVNVTVSTSAPCIHVYPAVVSLAKHFQGYCGFARLDIDLAADGSEILNKYNILDVPLFMFFRDGVQIHRFSGGSRSDLLGQVLKIAPVPPPPGAVQAR